MTSLAHCVRLFLCEVGYSILPCVLWSYAAHFDKCIIYMCVTSRRKEYKVRLSVRDTLEEDESESGRAAPSPVWALSHQLFADCRDDVCVCVM